MTVNRLPYSDPLRAGRHPFQTYLLALCVVSGAPMAAGQVTANSLEEQLPEPLVIAWGVMLVFGAGWVCRCVHHLRFWCGLYA